MKTSAILHKAGDVLRERGWCQFTLTNDAGQVCALGAFWVDGKSTPGVFRLVVTGDESSGGVAAWNNAPDRTAEEVQVAMDAAYVLQLQEEGIEPEDVL